ncbi:MAG: hypothetical protein ACF8NJ_07790 [Phycisphaerales bacterium JB038]
MSDLLTGVWGFQIQIVPVALAVLLLEVPNWIRRRQKFFYVPLYFSVFPLRELNADLAHYLGEDYFLGLKNTPGAALDLRRRIMFTALLSLVLSALVIPAFAGVASALFLPTTVLPQFIAVFIMYTLIRVARAIVNFPRHAIGSRRNTALLSLIYFGYIGVAAHTIARTYGFARAYVERGEWGGLILAISHAVFSRIVVEFLLLALLTAAFTSVVMDREIRKENLKHLLDDDIV